MSIETFEPSKEIPEKRAGVLALATQKLDNLKSKQAEKEPEDLDDKTQELLENPEFVELQTHPKEATALYFEELKLDPETATLDELKPLGHFLVLDKKSENLAESSEAIENA